MRLSTFMSLGILTTHFCFLQCATDNPSGPVHEERVPVVRTNQPPVILRIETASDTVRVDETLRCVCTAEDPDGDSLSYAWAFYKAAEHSTIDNYDFDLHMNRGEVSEEASRAVWTPGRLPGKYIVFCKVTDRAGFEVLDKKLIHVTFTGTLHAVTDQVVYQPMDTIWCTIENRAFERIWFEFCGWYIWSHTEVVINGSWIDVPDPAGCQGLNYPHASPIDIDSRVTSFFHDFPRSTESGIAPGVYRLFFKYHFPESGVQLNEVLYSNEFEVVAGPPATKKP